MGKKSGNDEKKKLGPFDSNETGKLKNVQQIDSKEIGKWGNAGIPCKYENTTSLHGQVCPHCECTCAGKLRFFSELIPIYLKILSLCK